MLMSIIENLAAWYLDAGRDLPARHRAFLQALSAELPERSHSGLLAQLLKRLVNLGLDHTAQMLINPLAMLLAELLKHLLVRVGQINLKRH
jgi:hypothetical protein